jgi:hypothetical protein
VNAEVTISAVRQGFSYERARFVAGTPEETLEKIDLWLRNLANENPDEILIRVLRPR